MSKEYGRPEEYLASVYVDGKCIKRRVECLISFSNNPLSYPKIAIVLKNKSAYSVISSKFHFIFDFQSPLIIFQVFLI